MTKENTQLIFDTPPSPEDLAWYERNETKLYKILDVSLRKQLKIFDEVLQKAQQGEIPGEAVLAFIDPRFTGPVGDVSAIDTIGNFLKQKLSVYTLELVDPDELATYTHLIEEKRAELYAALQLRNPNVWLDEPFTPQESLATNSGHDVIVEYRSAVEKLFDFLENHLEVDHDGIVRFLKVRLYLFKKYLLTNQDPSGQPLSERAEKVLTKEIPLIQKALHRLAAPNKSGDEEE